METTTTAEVTEKEKKPSKLNSDKLKLRFVQMVVMFAAISIFSLLALNFFYVNSALLQRKHQVAENSVHAVAEAIGVQVNYIEKSLLNLANQTDLVQAVQQRDSAQLQNIEQRIASVFEEVNGVRIFLTMPSAQQADSVMPTGYGMITMLRKAFEGYTPQPEVHWLKDSAPALNFVVPVIDRNSGQAVASLWLSLKPSWFQSTLSHFKQAPGFLMLRQVFDKQSSKTLAQVGDVALKNNVEADFTTVVNNSHWELALWLNHELFTSNNNALFFFVAAVVASLFTALGFLAYRVVCKDIESDLLNFNRLIVNYLNNDKKPLPNFNLPSVRSMAKSLKLSVGDRDPATHSLAEAASTDSSSVEKTLLNDNTDSSITFNPVFQKNTAVEVVDLEEAEQHDVNIPRTIFRQYDIRGLADKELNDENVLLLGRALGTIIREAGERTVVVGRDGRLSSPEYSAVLIQGLQASGLVVKDVGAVPTPVLYFAIHFLKAQSGVMLTGSHNPAEYNGFKMVVAGETLSGEKIQDLYQRMLEKKFIPGHGSVSNNSIEKAYLDTVASKFMFKRALKVVIDCANGITGSIAPQLLQQLGLDVVCLNTEVDGHFPNHDPDPSQPENMQQLIDAVKAEQADLGIAFDGDGDRVGLVTNEGNIIWPDRIMMLLAKHLLAKHPKANIVFDIKCSRHLAEIIKHYDGNPVICKTGHSLIKAKMKECNALLGGEMSGHIFVKDNWYGFDDGLFAAAQLLEIIANKEEDRTTEEIFAQFPNSISTPELKVFVDEQQKFHIVDMLAQHSKEFPKGNMITLDGVRVEFPDGWGLVRASNTTPCIIMRFEADDEIVLQRIQKLFKDELLAINPHLQFNF